MGAKLIKIRYTWLFVLVMLICSSAMGGEYAANFLEIGVNARALAMGGAFSAVADDGSSFYWNPAGLSYLKRVQISGMYAQQFGSIKDPMGSYHHLGIALPLTGDAVIAANWIRFSVDDIPVYSELSGTYWDRLHNLDLRPSGEPEGYIADSEDAIFFSFSKMNRWDADLGWDYQRIRLELPVGINIKWIRQKLGEGEASGIGVDLGIQFRIYLDNFFDIEELGAFSISLFMKDLTQTKLSWNTRYEDVVPYHLIWGLAYQFPLPIKNQRLSIAYDRQWLYDDARRFGIELSSFDVLKLRIGSVLYLRNRQYHLSAGAGLRIWKLNLDYAYINHDLTGLNRISCFITF